MSVRASNWDEVWAEYDARYATPAPIPAGKAPPHAPPHAPPNAPLGSARSQAMRRGAGALTVLLGLAVLAGGAALAYAAAPYVLARDLAAAWQQGAPTALTAPLDWAALRREFQAGMVGEARALPPGRTAGLSADGAAFLDSLGAQVAIDLATAEGLDGLVRRHLGFDQPWAAHGPAPAVALTPLSLTTARAEVPPAAGGEGRVVLTLALADPLRLRWQVQAVRLAE